jgi:hypothetical protein
LCGGVVDAEGNKSLLYSDEEFAKICCGLWKKVQKSLWVVEECDESAQLWIVEESVKNFVGCGRM